MRLHDWTGPDEIADLRTANALPGLLHRYGSVQPRVVVGVLNHAARLGAQSVIIERRYIDADWRDEHAHFYASTYRRYPSVAHRLHFFHEPPPPALSNLDEPASLEGLTYLGYSVMRPVPGAPVGRTMLAPLPRHRGQVTCLAQDHVDLYGTRLSIEATPFIAQDAQLTRCAHTTTWVTAYLNYLRGSGRRVLPWEIAGIASTATVHGRSLPSPGLTVAQIAETARAVGLPPLVYPLSQLPTGETVPKIICRYLNSGCPVIVAGGGHAFVLIGYGRSRDSSGAELLHFIRQDDEVGPYQVVPHWQLDPYADWMHAIVPLPPKAYVAAEAAEALGRSTLAKTLADLAGVPALDMLARRMQPKGGVTLRTTLVPSNDFKEGLDQRGMPAVERAIYQRMPLPRYVWVVEATDIAARDAGQPCVLAEVLIDATEHVRDLHSLAWRVPTAMFSWLPDENELRERRDLPEPSPVRSVCRAHR